VAKELGVDGVGRQACSSKALGHLMAEGGADSPVASQKEEKA